MEKTLYNRHGDAVAYIADDYHHTVYLLDGQPVAYIYEDRHIHGINGRHLGWFVNEMAFNHNGERVGFTAGTCPVPVAREPVKAEKHNRDETRPRWAAPPFPNLSFDYAADGLEVFLKKGEVMRQPA